MIVEPQRICKGICKKFKVTKPAGSSRYGSGQGRCMTCDAWIDHKGARLKDGSPATKGSIGWTCICCNFRVRQKPRNKIYKEKLRNSQDSARIPKYHQLMLPILQICSQKRYMQQEMSDIIVDRFNLTKQERMIILRGKETLLTNRIYWATLYLRKANLLYKDGSFFCITSDGHEILKQNPSKIDKKFLLKILAFAKWINKSDKEEKSMTNAKIDDLITESLDLMKHDGIYLEDLAKSLNISDDVKDLLVHKLLDMHGVTKEEIQHQGELLEVLLKYESASDDTGSENKSVDESIEILLDSGEFTVDYDISYLNKHQTKMIQKIVSCLPESICDFKTGEIERMMWKHGTSASEIEMEFDMDIEKFIELAYATEPPNKISMIREFERVRSLIGRVPTKQNIDEHSEFDSLQYDKEFQSWEHMLERLGYNPWYREAKDHKNVIESESIHDTDTYKKSDNGLEHSELELLKQNIKEELKDEPVMLELFGVLDQDITKLDKAQLQVIIDRLPRNHSDFTIL